MSSDSALTPKWYTTAQVAELLGFGLYKIKALIEIVVISHTATVGGTLRRRTCRSHRSRYGRWRGSRGRQPEVVARPAVPDVRARTDLEVEPTLSTSTHHDGYQRA